MLGRIVGRRWVGGANGVVLGGVVGWSLYCDD